MSPIVAQHSLQLRGHTSLQRGRLHLIQACYCARADQQVITLLFCDSSLHICHHDLIMPRHHESWSPEDKSCILTICKMQIFSVTGQLCTQASQTRSNITWNGKGG